MRNGPFKFRLPPSLFEVVEAICLIRQRMAGRNAYLACKFAKHADMERFHIFRMECQMRRLVF
jgi:hypothetical protein